MKNLKLIIAVLLFVLTSCGYQFEGGGYINSDVTHVAVEMMENKSSATGASVVFTDALIKEITGRTDTKLVDEAQGVVVLKGTVNTITFATLSLSTTENVVERRATANIDMQLVDKDEKIIWSVKNFTTREEYKVSADKIEEDSNKIEALKKISTRTAEKVVSKMMNNF